MQMKYPETSSGCKQLLPHPQHTESKVPRIAALWDAVFVAEKCCRAQECDATNDAMKICSWYHKNKTISDVQFLSGQCLKNENK